MLKLKPGSVKLPSEVNSTVNEPEVEVIVGIVPAPV